MLNQEQLLAINLEDLDLSVRTRHVLQNAKIRSVGELAGWDEQSIKKLGNCGAKTLGELRDLLGRYGLNFGMTFGQTAEENGSSDETTIRISDLDESTFLRLLLRVRELGFSVRATNALSTERIEFVGDLIQKTANDLAHVQSLGRRTIGEIRSRLADFNLKLGTKIIGWETTSAKELRKSQDRIKNSPLLALRREIANARRGNSLEEELQEILKAAANERDSEMACSLFGWSGRGRRTLESVGGDYAMTRERVRQITTKISKKIKQNEYDCPWLEKALACLRTNCPATAAAMADRLRSEGITIAPFEISGLETACELLRKPLGLKDVFVGSTLVYTNSRTPMSIVDFFRLCRKITSRSGCANFESICDELRVPEDQRQHLRTLASLDHLCEWLDEGRQWLFAAGVPPTIPSGRSRPIRLRQADKSKSAISATIAFVFGKFNPNADCRMGSTSTAAIEWAPANLAPRENPPQPLNKSISFIELTIPPVESVFR
jgi:hypothetical protein